MVSDRPRKGEHRFHIAFANSARIAHCAGVMAKGRRDRAAEEDLVSRAIVLWLALACGIAAPSPRSLLDADEHFEETVVSTVDTIDRLLGGDLDRVTAQPDGQMMLSALPPLVLLPGCESGAGPWRWPKLVKTRLVLTSCSISPLRLAP